METPNLDAVVVAERAATNCHEREWSEVDLAPLTDPRRAGRALAAEAELEALKGRVTELESALRRIVLARKASIDSLMSRDREAGDAAMYEIEDAFSGARAALGGNKISRDPKRYATTDGKPPDESLAGYDSAAPKPINPATGQHGAYWVLCEEERGKGFVRPVRDSYKHKKCGMSTRMGRKLAETYAREPKFYGATFCVCCGVHLPVSEFIWDGTNEDVGS
jgi:hypothetical protein